MRRTSYVPAGWPPVPQPGQLDPSQLAAVRVRGPVARIAGAPGTGKTTVAVHSVLDRVRRDGIAASQVLVLAASRVQAAATRSTVTRLLGAATGLPAARSVQAFGFAILAAQAARQGTPPPQLLSGAEQDAILASLLAGHEADPGRGPAWPAELTEARGTRGFRGQLRDLLMRAVEHGVTPGELRALGEQHGEPAWAAAAALLHEYDQVTALARPGAYDPSWVLGAAAGVLAQDEQAAAGLARRRRVIVIDDAQELTAAGAQLVTAVAESGIEVVLIGDPDAATQTFRGADPRLFGTGWPGLALPEPLVLRTRWRAAAPIAHVTAVMAGTVGVAGISAHRLARPAAGPPEEHAGAGPEPDAVSCVVAASPAAEEAHIAALLRRAHLIEGIPWEQMAVIVRGSGRASALRQALTGAQVPLDESTAPLPLREQPAVRPLTALYAAALALAGYPVSGGLDAEQLDDLLSSPLLGSDPVRARQARRELARQERARGGTARGPALVAAHVQRALAPVQPGESAGADGALPPEAGAADPAEREGAAPADALEPVRALIRVLAAGIRAASTAAGRHVTCEHVLWSLWQAAGVAGEWKERALAGSARADRDLDAVVSLFGAAGAYAGRLPEMGPGGFLDYLLSQEVAADSLAARGQRGQEVTLTTPHQAAGREWDLVVIAGLQEGAWPDTRLRGSMLSSERLVDLVTGRGDSVRAQRSAVLHDENRLLCSALGRARKRLVLTAVSDSEQHPSAYLALLRDAAGLPGPHAAAPAPRPATMTGLVGELRRRLALATSPGERLAHARRLAILAQLGVPGAAPGQWWSQRQLSSTAPLRAQDAQVPVSPSRVEGFGQCPLRWFLTSSGGQPSYPAAASALGTLVHDIASRHETDLAAMEAELDARWPELELPPGWISRARRAEAGDMLRRYAGYAASVSAEGRRTAGTEIDIDVVVGRARIRGRIDRLEADDRGGLRVVDLKTGRTKPVKDQVAEHPQLGTYQVAIESGALAGYGTRSSGAALVQLGTAAGRTASVQVQGPLAQADDPSWAAQLLARTAEGMASGEFAARPGTWCRTCPSVRNCPARPEGATL